MTENDLQPGAQRRRVITASMVGTTVEYFDLYIYSLAAGLFFAHQFFPNTSPLVGVIASFGTLAVGFLFRPLGGIIGGHFGDRYGRKKVLVVSMLMMGIATFAIGVLPTYETIGIAAPIILVLVRILQGLGAGAEYGGGLLMLIEHQGKDRRGFWGSILACALWIGIAFGTIIFAAITQLPEDVQEWAWRVPFIASAGLVFIGLWVRLGVAESPLFVQAAAMAKKAGREALPLADLFRNHRKAIVLTTFVAFGAGASYQIYNTFATAYAKSLDLPIGTILVFQFANAIFALAATVFFGWLSDRVGRRILAIVGSIVLVPSVFLLFWSLNEGLLPLVMVSLLMAEIGHSMVNGPLGAFLAESFKTRARYTGVSIAYQIGAGAMAGSVPLIASAVLSLSGGAPHVYSVVVVMAVISFLTMLGAFLAPERARQALSSEFDDSDAGQDDDLPVDHTALRA